MLTKKHLLMVTLLVVSFTALTINEVRAQSLFEPVEPSRTCTVALSGGVSSEVIAGPDSPGSMSTTGPFPKIGPCPTGYSGSCAIWEYSWIHSGFNPAHSLVSFDADLEVLKAEEWNGVDAWGNTGVTVSSFPAGDSSTKFGANVGDARFLRFNSNGSNFSARFFTRKGILPGTVSGGVHGGNKQGSCELQGADGLRDDSLLTGITTNVIEDLGPDGCVVNRVVDENECTVSISIVDDPNQNCTVSLGEVVTIGGVEPLELTCTAEAVVPGSTKYCWVNLAGGMDCIFY